MQVFFVCSLSVMRFSCALQSGVPEPDDRLRSDLVHEAGNRVASVESVESVARLLRRRVLHAARTRALHALHARPHAAALLATNMEPEGGLQRSVGHPLNTTRVHVLMFGMLYPLQDDPDAHPAHGVHVQEQRLRGEGA